jgi:hypothetical protein
MVGGWSACQLPSCSFCVRLCAVQIDSVSGSQMAQNCLDVFDESVAFGTV